MYSEIVSKIKDFKQQDVLFLGMGNEALGDDAAGPYFISLLEENKNKHSFKYFDCGTVLESFFSKIKAQQPKLIVFVDAADFGQSAGKVINADINNIENASASTHSLPLSVFAKFLINEMPAAPEFMFIAIQSANLEYGAPLNTEIEKNLKSLAEEIYK
ncbi:hydrogenase 3 maturation protease [Elusimicrobium posterum]|uniref:hydrogenase 3 maturation endopeptidase HyCI n=1 Tax=Elusimicrobium posterum TaxID=3116653 RepID=UPI003C77CB95